MTSRVTSMTFAMARVWRKLFFVTLCLTLCLVRATLHVRERNDTVVPSTHAPSSFTALVDGKTMPPSPEVMITRLNPGGRPIYLQPPRWHAADAGPSNASTLPAASVSPHATHQAASRSRTPNVLPVGRQVMVTIPTIDGDRHVALYIPTSYPERVRSYFAHMHKKDQRRRHRADAAHAESDHNNERPRPVQHRSMRKHHSRLSNEEGEATSSLPALVLQFHGLNDECARFMNNTGFLDAAEREGFVVASACGSLGLFGVAWNAGTCCGFLHNRPDDVAFAHTIIETLMYGRGVLSGYSGKLSVSDQVEHSSFTLSHSRHAAHSCRRPRHAQLLSQRINPLLSHRARPALQTGGHTDSARVRPDAWLLAIDPARVMAMGFSNGGMLAEVLGCTSPMGFAAVVSISGVVEMAPGNAAGLQKCDASIALNASGQRPSVLLVHGDADVMVPWGGNRLLGFPPVLDNLAGWVRRNNCTAEPRVTINTTNFVNEQYRDCAVSSAVDSRQLRSPHGVYTDSVDKRAGRPTSMVELVRVRGGQHQWYDTDEFSTEQYVIQFGRRVFGHY